MDIQQEAVKTITVVISPGMAVELSEAQRTFLVGSNLNKYSPAMYIVAHDENISNFVNAVQGNQSLLSSIPDYLGGPNTVLSSSGLIQSIIKEVVKRSGESTAVILDTLIYCPEVISFGNIFGAFGAFNNSEKFFQDVHAIEPTSLPLFCMFSTINKETLKFIKVKPQNNDAAVAAGHVNIYN